MLWRPPCRSGSPASYGAAPVEGSERVASIYNVISLEYVAYTSLFRAESDGRAAIDGDLVLVVIMRLLLVACECVCCHSPYCVPILEAEMYKTCSTEKKKSCALC